MNEITPTERLDFTIEKVEPSLEASQLLAPNGNHHPAEYAESVLTWG